MDRVKSGGGAESKRRPWFREDSMIGGGCGPVGVGHTNGAPQIPSLRFAPVGMTKGECR
jgi:hypothetical protein